MTQELKKATPVKKTKIAEQKTNEIIQPENTLVNFSAENLLSEAIKNNVSVDTVERLVALAKDMQAIYAKQQFDKAMAGFQAECPVIKKTKDGGKTNSGVVAYKYAPLESIVEQVKTLLDKYGFSYSADMKLLDTGVTAYITITHIAGHSKTTEMTVPFGTKTNVMSAPQQIAATQTFAKRYAFCNAFGILTGDEDNDGANIERTNNGEIIEKATNKSPSPKQMKFIRDLAEQKGYTMEDVLNMQKQKLRSPSELIEHLKTIQPKELPVIQQDESLEKIGNELDF